MKRTACCLFLLLGSVAISPVLAAAQGWAAQPGTAAPAPAGPTQVISGNPFGFVFDLVNAEYERRAGSAITVGAGASRGNWGASNGRPYVNGDIFVRYFPAGQAFDGRSFGVKAGMTQVPGSDRTYFGLGVDANQTWMLNRHFAFSTGFGLKRLLGTDGLNGPRIIPTLRINVGVGF